MKWEKLAFEVIHWNTGPVQTLSIASVISNQHTVTKLYTLRNLILNPTGHWMEPYLHLLIRCILLWGQGWVARRSTCQQQFDASGYSHSHVPIQQILRSAFPLSQQWDHANMRKKNKNVLKNILLFAGLQKRHRLKAVHQSQRSQPWTSGDIMSWVGACAGARIYLDCFNGPRLAAPLSRASSGKSGLWNSLGFTIQALNTYSLFMYIWNVWPLGTNDICEDIYKMQRYNTLYWIFGHSAKAHCYICISGVRSSLV